MLIIKIGYFNWNTFLALCAEINLLDTKTWQG